MGNESIVKTPNMGSGVIPVIKLTLDFIVYNNNSLSNEKNLAIQPDGTISLFLYTVQEKDITLSREGHLLLYSRVGVSAKVPGHFIIMPVQGIELRGISFTPFIIAPEKPIAIDLYNVSKEYSLIKGVEMNIARLVYFPTGLSKETHQLRFDSPIK